jgi:hypothetical protein
MLRGRASPELTDSCRVQLHGRVGDSDRQPSQCRRLEANDLATPDPGRRASGWRSPCGLNSEPLSNHRA